MNDSIAEQVQTESRLDKSGERVRDMFAQIAPRYDAMNHILSMGIDIRWRKRVVRMLRLDSARPVLDCCTGTGDLALMLAKASVGRFPVVGTDFCAPMLDLARKKQAKQHAAADLQFIEADSQELPFPDHYFQAVTVAFGLRNVQDTRAGIDEMIRVCAPGGQVCILEFSMPTAPGLRQAYSFYFQQVLPRVGQRLARNNRDAYEYLPSSVAEFPSGPALVELLALAGLEQVQVCPLTFGIASIYLGQKK